MREVDIKLLWGRSGGLCSMCRTPLTMDKNMVDGEFHVGEHAHIVGETESSPRGKSSLSEEERKTYPNRILLCPTCHTTIDKEEMSYPVEKLHQIKSDHEFSVQRTLSGYQDEKSRADELVYAHLIDRVVQACRLPKWSSWTSHLLAGELLQDQIVDDLFALRCTMMAANWSGTFAELEFALKSVALVLNDVAQLFCMHAKKTQVNDVSFWAVDRFYQIDEWNEKLYEELSAEFDQWQQAYRNLLFEAAKAVNWLASVVRRNINPMFFAIEGKFTVGYEVGLAWREHVLEYTPEEIAQMPERYVKLRSDIPQSPWKSNEDLLRFLNGEMPAIEETSPDGPPGDA